MPPMSPQDAQGIVDILNSIQDAEASGKAPPGSYQRYLADFQSQSEYSMPTDRGGDGFTGRIDGGVTRAPWRGEYDMPGNFERDQRMANSMAEDAAIRESGKYSRRRQEEDGPEGNYVFSKYPGVEHDIWRVEHGFGKSYSVRGALLDQDEKKELHRKQKGFARHQRKLLGIPEALSYEDVHGKPRPQSDRVKRYMEEWGY